MTVDVHVPEFGPYAGVVLVADQALTPDEARALADQIRDAADFAEEV
jgi:phosphoribosylaminoimidazole-succinocarboxamide synthase